MMLELSGKEFKAALTIMFHALTTNPFEMNEENFSVKKEIILRTK